MPLEILICTSLHFWTEPWLRATSYPGGTEDILAASSPEVAAVLAIEKVLRSILHEAEDLAQGTVTKILLGLSSAATHRPNSFALEQCLARIDILANSYSESSSVATIASLLAELGRLAFLTNRKHARSSARVAMQSLCSSLVENTEMADEARFAVDTFAEMFAAAMHADYFATSHALKGAQELADLDGNNAASAKSRYAAIVSLLELGGVALETRRYSLALRIAQIIRSAGIDLTAGARSISRQSVSSKIQMKSELSGDVFGSDVEAAVKRFSDWATRLPDNVTNAPNGPDQPVDPEHRQRSGTL